MKIIIFGYGNLGKALANHAISNNYNTLIVSRQKIDHDDLTFITIEKFNSLINNLSNFCLISTIPPNEQQEDFVLSNINSKAIANAKKIIYVSCNPSTQARDTQILQSHNYELNKLSVVDMFPHTPHVETVGIFEKSK